ncbi:MAG: amidohydrolase [Desulfosarcinaceae bacterium]|nr:amidohydrolase [Desulfosarcinaceae bacterium]
MESLHATLIQADLTWEDGAANRDALSRMIASVDDPGDLIVLPEMFATGFSMAPEGLAETMTGESVQWLSRVAAETGAAVTGSLMMVDANLYYNRLIWMTPDGKFRTYDKKHLFTYAGEDTVYAAGTRPLQVSLKGWQIRPMICYDLRFPAWVRNRRPYYDLALFVANWPAARADHWRTLLKARAIENQSYVIGVNRVGEDGNGQVYSGDSMVVDPAGRICFHRALEPCVHRLELDRELLRTYRRDFPALADADDFSWRKSE